MPIFFGVLTGAMMGVYAKDVLFAYRDGSYDCIMLPYLPVHELVVQRDVVHSSSNYIDVFINAAYSANPEAQDPLSAGAKVFHATTWGYDGYYLPLGGDSQGKETVLYVDTTLLRATAIFTCVVSWALFCMVLFGFRFHGKRDSVRRDNVDAGLESSFANASHELKTPLMAIRGYTESIRDGAIEEGFALERIDAAVDKMAETVEGILKISRSGVA